MLNFIYYPVSFILWCWHWVFGLIFGDANAVGWALSIVFLVFTLRVILLKPAIAQVRSMRKMQEFAPEMKKLQKKYANDRQRQAQEMQKLQREHGVNPVGGCLPMVLQVPVFIGLNHVLRSFNPHSSTNYFFKQHDVTSYLHADLFGAHLGDALLGIGQLSADPGWHWTVAPVAIPLMILASIATHFTARLSVQRQLSMGTPGTPQTAMMNKVTLYLFPLGVLVFGGSFPVGLLLYWLSNNAWTLGQQRFVFMRMDREEQEKKAVALETRSALAPKPGQKPAQVRKRPAGAPDAADDDTTATDSASATKAAPGAKRTTGAKPVTRAKPAPGAKPAGARSSAARTGQGKPATGAKPNPNRSGAGKAGTSGTGTGTGTGSGAKSAGVQRNPAKSNGTNGSTPKPGAKPTSRTKRQG